MNKSEKAGYDMANAIVQFIHLMYQKKTATRVIEAVIVQLQKRKSEFKW